MKNASDAKESAPTAHLRAGLGALFPIPPVPQLERVPEPKPLKKAPVAGYDVKTLKRQVEFLQKEITERERIHAQVYSQNEEMWKYIQDLINASHENANRMKEHCAKLHSDVVSLGSERKELAEKVGLARDSKALLQQIHRNLGNAKFNRDELEQIRENAEHAYIAARKENEMLENSLQNKVKEMQMMRWKLDENQNREKYDALLTCADEFWNSSKIVLRNALHRFMDGVESRIRLSRVAVKIRELNYRHLKKKHFALYKEFIGRKRIMRRAIKARNMETLQYHFLKFKLFKVMASVHHSARRRLTLQRTFSTWKGRHAAHRFDRWSQIVIVQFQDKQFLRRIFTAWKGSVTFLKWNSQEVALLEWTAVRHRLKKIMAAWSALVPDGQSLERDRLVTMGSMLQKRLFHEWKRACKAAWQRRGRLLLRFFRNLRRMVETEIIVEKTTSSANLWHLRLIWRRFRRNLVKVQHERLASRRVRATYAHLSKHRRGILHAFRQLLLHSVSSQKKRTFANAAKVSHETYCRVIALRLWYFNAQTNIRRRGDTRFRLLKLGMHTWRFFSMSMRMQVRGGGVCSRYLQQKNKATSRESFRTWRRRAKRSYALRSLRDFVTTKHRNVVNRHFFCMWRGAWSRRIYWALKEQKIEVARNMALAELKQGEILDLKKNHEELLDLAQDAEEKLKEMELERDDKEKEMLDYLAAYEARNEEKRKLEIDMAALLKELKRSESERKKLQVVESMLIEQSEREKAILAEKKANAEFMIDMMRKEASQLEQDAAVAKEQSDNSARRAEAAIERSKKELNDGKEKQIRLHEILEEKRIESEGLIKERDALNAELDKVQKKLNEVVGCDPPHLIEDQNILRARNSELLEIQSNANLAEARVLELTKIIDEMEVLL